MSKRMLDVVAALIVENGRYFLCQRHAHDRYGGLWEFPGGGVEKGESEFTAIEREMLEEVDLVVKACTVVERFYDEDPTLIITIALIECQVVSGTPVTKDCQALGFFTLAEMARMDLAPADIKILEYLKKNNLSV